LFIKDNDSNRILIKILPNLPNDEIGECNVQEDSSDEHSYKGVIKSKRKINNSFYLNNVSAMDIRGDFGSDDENSLLVYTDQC